VPSVVVDVLTHSAVDSITCLTGVSSTGRTMPVDVGALNRMAVLSNDVVFGTVNANARHYELACDALAAADRGWLERLISRRVPLAEFEQAFTRRDDDVKVVLTLP
jgi:hypothetical protein